MPFAVAVPIVLAVVAAAGAAATAVSAKNQADTQAKIAKQQAAYATQAAASNEAEFRRNQDREMARRRALLGGAGVDPTTGSPLLGSQDYASEVELQALKIRQGGAVESTRLSQQASLLRQQGSAELTGGLIRSGSLLLQGAGQSYVNYKYPQGAAYG